MRLDKFLKVSRLIRRRTVAKTACAAGRVTLNGTTAKAGSRVEPGDVLTIDFGNRELTVRVLAVAEHVPASRAQELYEVVDEVYKERA